MSDEMYEKQLALLPLIRQKEILKKKDKNKQKLSLAGDILVKKILGKQNFLNPEKIEIRYGIHGKPYAINVKTHFNISHSENITVLAISDAPIGVDTEIIRDFSAITAKKLFSEEELKYISGNNKNSKEEMQKAFYEIWTAKEAYLKYLGTGLSGGINALSLTFDGKKLITNKNDIELHFDYSVPHAVTAVITAKINH